MANKKDNIDNSNKKLLKLLILTADKRDNIKNNNKK